MKIIIDDFTTNKNNGLMTIFLLLNYRIGRYFLLKRRKYKYVFTPFYFLLYINHRILSLILGCFVPFSCQIGRRVEFKHGFFGVFISSKAIINDDCKILHQVTIGSNYGSNGEILAPLIENGVFIGVGAKVIGGISVGSMSKIGANALIVKSVPSNSKCYSPMANIV